jgi:lipopolysaccharide export LptBFGC system permease protein LptF
VCDRNICNEYGRFVIRLKPLFLSITCLSLLISNLSCTSNKEAKVNASSPQKPLASQEYNASDIIFPLYRKVANPQEFGYTELTHLIYARRWDSLRMHDITIIEFSQDKPTRFIVAKEMLWDSQQRTWTVSDGQKYTLALDGSYSNIAKLSKQQLQIPLTPSQFSDFCPDDLSFPDILSNEYMQVRYPNGTIGKRIQRSLSTLSLNRHGSNLKRVVIIDIGDPNRIQVLYAETAKLDRQKDSWYSHNGHVYTIFLDGSPPSILKFDQQIIQLPRRTQ